MMANDQLPVRRSGDILLICPPFFSLNRPSLAPHLPECIPTAEGLFAEVYYANLHLARDLGENPYNAAAESSRGLLAERLFSPYAFPDMSFDDEIYSRREEEMRLSPLPWKEWDFPGRLADLESSVGGWLREFRTLIARSDFRVFGLSTTCAQNVSCACLARIIKEEKPDSLVLIGGANCDGDMANGIAALSSDFDYIFVGDAEATFRTFCRDLRNNRLPDSRFVLGSATVDLDQV